MPVQKLKYSKVLTLLFSAISFDGSASGMSLIFGAFNEPKGERAGVESAVWLEPQDYYAFRFSALFFDGKNAFKESDFFAGISAAAFVQAGTEQIKPYLGLGLEASSTVYCIILHDDDEDEGYNFTDEECSGGKQGVLAIYPEVGIRFNLGAVTVSPYMRRYFDTNDNHPVTNAYGVNFSVNFSLP